MDAAQPSTLARGRTATGIAFDDSGSGPPIVLVHAGVADRRMWDDLAGRLSGRYRVIRHDVRGVGESLPPTGPWSHHGDLLALLDDLLIARAHFVGASMGAGIAVEVALARPGIAASRPTTAFVDIGTRARLSRSAARPRKCGLPPLAPGG